MNIDYRIVIVTLLVVLGYLLARALQTRPPDAAERAVPDAEHGHRDNVTPLKKAV